MPIDPPVPPPQFHTPALVKGLRTDVPMSRTAVEGTGDWPERWGRARGTRLGYALALVVVGSVAFVFLVLPILLALLG